MTPLAACEREVTCAIADDESAWTIFTDSRRLTRKLLAVAARWGVTPQRHGAGHAFTLPRGAVRFVGPQRVTDRQREARRQAIQKARAAPRTPVPVQAAEGVAPSGRGEIPAHPARPTEPRDLDALEATSEEAQR